jgi:microcystin degradation protein MlrC
MKAKAPLRLAIGGIHIESSTFSPLLTRRADFLALTGAAMMARYPFLSAPEFAIIRPVPLAHFRALPGGPVARACYESMKAEILERLDAAGPVDAFYLDCHGAMSVEGMDDAEADLAEAIRARVGRELPLTCSQDLHGNVSARLMEHVDWITTYRTAPHVDWMETRERAVSLLADWWRAPRPVFRAWTGIPVLVSGEQSSTECEPGRGLYAPLADESRLPGVLDASLWVGYAWADQARAGACAVALGQDREATANLSASIARRYWDARSEFDFISPARSVEDGIREALTDGPNPFFLSDAGDNPTAGSTGDVTGVLQILARQPEIAGENGRHAIFAFIADAESARTAAAAGAGATVDLRLGGKLDPRHAPWPCRARVEFVSPGHGEPDDLEVVLGLGGLRVIVAARRRAYHRLEDFLRLGLDPREADLVVVKIGYLEPELKAMAARHLLLLSEGSVPPRIPFDRYQKLRRPIHPRDGEFSWEPETRIWVSF